MTKRPEVKAWAITINGQWAGDIDKVVDMIDTALHAANRCGCDALAKKTGKRTGEGYVLSAKEIA